MKSQKTNAFQLAIAGGVLVLVLVCATFAWFAVGDHAWVNKIIASIASPDVPSQLNSIEYKSDGDWKTYDGGQLEMLPGQVWSFRIKFTAQPTDTITMTMSDISASFREIPKETENENDSQSTTQFTVVTKGKMLSNVLQYRINPTENMPFSNVEVKDSSCTLISKQVEEAYKSDNSYQYTYVYELKLKEDAGNDYMDMLLSFVMDVNLPSADDSGEAEGNS